MHNHVTCNKNIIMGLGQSKPTSTQGSNKETHIEMHETLLKMQMKCNA